MDPSYSAITHYPLIWECLCLKHLFVHSNHTKASPTGLPKSNMDTFWKKHMLYETITLTLRLSNMAGWKMHKETEQPTKPAQLSHPIHSKGWSRGIFGEFPQATQPIPESSRPKNERGTPPKKMEVWGFDKWRFSVGHLGIPHRGAALPCALAGSNSFCQTSHLWKPTRNGGFFVVPKVCQISKMNLSWMESKFDPIMKVFDTRMDMKGAKFEINLLKISLRPSTSSPSAQPGAAATGG